MGTNSHPAQPSSFRLGLGWAGLGWAALISLIVVRVMWTHFLPGPNFIVNRWVAVDAVEDFCG